MITFRLLSWEY